MVGHQNFEISPMFGFIKAAAYKYKRGDWNPQIKHKRNIIWRHCHLILIPRGVQVKLLPKIFKFFLLKSNSSKIFALPYSKREIFLGIQTHLNLFLCFFPNWSICQKVRMKGDIHSHF